jgi:hypothetical protein
MAEEPIYKCSYISNRFRLYANRLEIEQDALLFGKKEVILRRNIAGIKRPLGKRIEIQTTDGKKVQLNIVGQPANALYKKLIEIFFKPDEAL